MLACLAAYVQKKKKTFCDHAFGNGRRPSDMRPFTELTWEIFSFGIFPDAGMMERNRYTKIHCSNPKAPVTDFFFALLGIQIIPCIILHRQGSLEEYLLKDISETKDITRTYQIIFTDLCFWYFVSHIVNGNYVTIFASRTELRYQMFFQTVQQCSATKYCYHLL